MARVCQSKVLGVSTRQTGPRAAPHPITPPQKGVILRGKPRLDFSDAGAVDATHGVDEARRDVAELVVGVLVEMVGDVVDDAAAR
jgi:hypothetical protein